MLLIICERAYVLILYYKKECSLSWRHGFQCCLGYGRSPKPFLWLSLPPLPQSYDTALQTLTFSLLPGTFNCASLSQTILPPGESGLCLVYCVHLTFASVDCFIHFCGCISWQCMTSGPRCFPLSSTYAICVLL